MSLVALARQRLAEWEASGTAGGTRAEHGPKLAPKLTPCSTVPLSRERNGGTAVGVRTHSFPGPVFHASRGLENGTAGGTRVEHLPADWRDGLAMLAAMAEPDGWPRWRGPWERIVADALTLGETWAPQAFALGWRDVDLWGCDSDPSARRLDRDGLAVLLHGRRVLALTATAATIAIPDGRALSFYRAELSGSVPLWALTSD